MKNTFVTLNSFEPKNQAELLPKLKSKSSIKALKRKLPYHLLTKGNKLDSVPPKAPLRKYYFA